MRNLLRRLGIKAGDNTLDLVTPTLSIDGTEVTSTAAELNILDGVTATAAELNALDGITSTVAELNILDGVTATAAELNYLDITAAGTAQASKAVVLDANSQIDTLNYAGPPTTDSGVGAVAGTGNTVTEYGEGVVHKTVITHTAVDVALSDEAGVVAYGGLKIYDMPAGAILFLGAVTDIDLTKSSAGVNDDWDGDVGLGTTTADNDATLATTEQNIIPTTATPQASAGATTANAQSTATENAVVDGTGTDVDVFINLLVDDADHDVTGTACNLILNGTTTIHWINLGDY